MGEKQEFNNLYTSYTMRETQENKLLPQRAQDTTFNTKTKEDVGGGALLEVTRKHTVNKGKVTMQI